MKKLFLPFVGMVIFTMLSILQVPVCLAEETYHLLKEIPVGGEGVVNYLSIDSAARCLYVAHETKLVAIDLDKEMVVGEMTNASGIDGFALVPQFHRGFFSNGQDNQMGVVRVDTLRVLGTVPTGKKPGAILYEPTRQLLFTFNGEDQSASVFEADDTDFVTTIKLPGKPGVVTADSKTGRVYCSIENDNEITVIDAKTLKIADHWPISPGKKISGMAVDSARHRLFLSCSNQLLMMMDGAIGKVLATVPIGENAGANAFDPELRLVFSSCDNGMVTIAHEDTPDSLTVVQTLKTECGGRMTMVLDPKTHNIYLATAKYEPSTGRQPLKIVPGAFKIMVYAK